MIGQLHEISLTTRTPFWGGAPEQFKPADPMNFAVHGSVYMGCEGDRRSIMFDFECMTPTWFAAHGWSEGFGYGDLSIRSGRGFFFVHSWDATVLERHIRGVVEVEGETLDHIIEQIRLQLICEDE